MSTGFIKKNKRRLNPKFIFRYFLIQSYKRHAFSGLEKEHKCLNCGNVFHGNYCNVCGQYNCADRITTKSILSGFGNGFFNMDVRIVKTLMALILRPGMLIVDYLKGKRADYFRPFQLLFVLAAIYGLLLYFFPENKQDLDLSNLQLNNDITNPFWKGLADLFDNMTIKKYLKGVNDFFNSNVAFNAVLAMPFYALATKIAFRKRLYNVYHFNYMELIVVRAYVSCQFLFFSILWFPINRELSFWLEIILTGWTYLQLFGENKKLTVFRILWMYILFSLLILATILVLLLLIILFAFIIYESEKLF